jgi:APA family basic amino acid/polyamine antiporter
MLNRVKPLGRLLAEAGDDTAPHSLKRTLGPVQLIAMGIGAIIGTGIFVLTGVAAATRSGPSLTISFIVAGIVSALAALCYSEVASRVPISGSAYTFAYASLGEFLAWVIGWDLILEYGVGAATVSIGWSGYLTTFLKNIGLTIPNAWQHSPFDVGPTGLPLHGIVNLPAAIGILLVTILLIRGTRESATVNTIIVALKVAVVLFFIAVGLGHVNTANWHPYFPFGISGMLGGAAFIFFAYIGFDAVSTAAEETKNPARDLPIGILGSLAICTVLYIIVVAILTGLVPYTHLNVSSPVAFAIEQVGLPWAGTIISIGAIAGLTTVMLTMMFGQTRVIFAMSRDGLIPRRLAAIHPIFRTPALSTAILGILIAIVAAFSNINSVGSVTNMGTLAAFILVSISLPILRKKYPETKGFSVPFGPYIIPVLSALSAFGLILYLKVGSPTVGRTGIPVPWFAFVVWFIIGLAVYLLYGRSHSVVALEEQAANNTPI